MEGLTMLMFFLLSISFASSDQYYKACRPTECGGINVTYPFYVAGQQPSYCGFPGFQVTSCKTNLPLVNLSGDTYIINKISYTNQTLWIVNSAFSPSTFVCITLSSVHNLTLNKDILDFNSKPKEIVLLQDCSAEALQGMSKIMCKNDSYGNSSSSLAAVYDKDLKQKEVAGECRWAVSVPYEASDAAKMEDKMREGFALKGRDDTKRQRCQTSGGRCVYKTTFDFQCPGSDQ